MRPSNKSRSRNKPGNLGGNSSGNINNPNRPRLGNIINRVFESAGPDGKVRGTPQQIIEKYQALARDAQLSGDRVAAESFLQHSEHYSRMLGEATQAQNEQRQAFERDDSGREDGQSDQARDQQQREPQRDQQSRDAQQRDQQPREQQQRDQQPREAQPRDQQPRDQQPREYQNRDGQPREAQQREQQPREQSRSRQDNAPKPKAVVSSSLATIDTDDEASADALIYTPDSHRAPQPDVAPAFVAAEPVAPEPAAEKPAASPSDVPADVPAAADAAAPAEGTPKPAVKRGRPRRKAAPDPEAVATSAE